MKAFEDSLKIYNQLIAMGDFDGATAYLNAVDSICRDTQPSNRRIAFSSDGACQVREFGHEER